MTNAKVQLKVMDLLRTYLPKNIIISLDARLISDLKLDSDDASQFALDLEKIFSVKLSQIEWGNIFTVRDVINQLEKHVDAQIGGRSSQ